MDRKHLTNLDRRPSRALAHLTAALLLVAGCSHAAAGKAGVAVPADGAGSGQMRSATYVNANGLSGQLTTATISDPQLDNMVAARVTVPQGWKVQGMEMLGPCTPGPIPVYRASSPDGLMQIRQEPMVGWKWTAKGQPAPQGCLDIHEALSAENFLRRYVEMTMPGGAHLVGSVPVVSTYSEWAQKAAAQATEFNSHLPTPTHATFKGDTAALRVQVVNGTFVIEERLRAMLICSESNGDTLIKGGCTVRMDVLSAPQGKLDALMKLTDANHLPGALETEEYKNTVLSQLAEKNRRDGEARLAQLRQQSEAFSKFMYNNFQQSMERSEAQHQAFMDQQESSFRSSMNNANAAMNARTTAASDWVDYALDQQTVTGPGGTAKVSSAYTYTWTDGHGAYYQTNDGSANPNGSLQGNWSQTSQVHGNGQPK